MKQKQIIKNFFKVNEDIKSINKLGRMGAVVNMFFSLVGIVGYSIILWQSYTSDFINNNLNNLELQFLNTLALITLVAAPITFILNWRHYFGKHNKGIAGITAIIFSGIFLVFFAGGIIGGLMVLFGTNNYLKPKKAKHIEDKEFIKTGSIVSISFAFCLMIIFATLGIEWILNYQEFN